MSIDKEIIEKIWNRTKNKNLTSCQNKPKSYILGGQSGAGKSLLIEKIKAETSNNILIINADDFRRYHPEYKNFQNSDIENSPKFTAKFAGEVAEIILKKAIDNKFNVLMEGTFRTKETPLKTLSLLKDYGYETNVYIKATPKKESWNNCLERFDKMLKINPKEARYTDKSHHDIIVEKLAENVEYVYNSGLVDNLKMFTKFKKVYDSADINKYDLKETINKVLNFEEREKISKSRGKGFER